MANGNQTDLEIKARQGIDIGIIGPSDLVDKLQRTLKQFPTFVPHIRKCNREEEIAEASRQLSVDAEVLLYTDPYSYYKGRTAVVSKVPAHFVPLTGTGLYRAFYRIQRKRGVSALSIDSLAVNYVEKVMAELGAGDVRISHYPKLPQIDPEDVLQFHIRQFKSGKSEAALTGVQYVSERLSREGIANEWILPTEQDMVVSLERALLSTESRRSKESQIVVGIINIDDFRRASGRDASEHDIQRMKLDIHRILLEYVESWKGHLTHLGGDEYLFITTRGIFEQVTGGYKSVPLAKEVENRFGLTLSIGVGFGVSAYDAGTHARAALRHCKDGGGNMCFIVREDKSVIGPLELSEPLAFNLSLLDAGFLQRAEEAGLSTGYLSRLVNHVTRVGKLRFTARELAAVLGVTVRSTHRFLLAWLDAGLIEMAGEQRDGNKGRPTQIYHLKFLSELSRM